MKSLPLWKIETFPHYLKSTQLISDRLGRSVASGLILSDFSGMEVSILWFDMKDMFHRRLFSGGFSCRSAGWGVILRMCLSHRHLSIVGAGFRHPFLIGAGSFPFGRCVFVFSPAMVFSRAVRLGDVRGSGSVSVQKKDGGRLLAPALFPSSAYLSFIL